MRVHGVRSQICSSAVVTAAFARIIAPLCCASDVKIDSLQRLPKWKLHLLLFAMSSDSEDSTRRSERDRSRSPPNVEQLQPPQRDHFILQEDATTPHGKLQLQEP